MTKYSSLGPSGSQESTLEPYDPDLSSSFELQGPLSFSRCLFFVRFVSTYWNKYWDQSGGLSSVVDCLRPLIA